MQPDVAQVGVRAGRCPGHDGLDVGTCRHDLACRGAKRRPEALDLLITAARKNAERGPAGVEAKLACGVGAGGSRRPVAEWMPHELRCHSVRAKKLHFEWQDNRELAHAAQPRYPVRSPRPHLRGDVVEHRNTGRGGRCRDAQMVSRVIHQDHEVVPLGR